jgi:Tol biopolymer transport system component
VVNPTPRMTVVEAPLLRAGGAAASLTVRGSGFRQDSRIQVAGTALETQYRTGADLTAMIPPQLLATAGKLAVSVMTPGPGGGASVSALITVLPALPGRFVVFTSNRRGGRNHIFLLDRESGKLDPLEEANSPNASDGYPTISADGRLIVFQSDRNRSQYDVFLFDREKRILDPLPELNHPTAFDGFPRVSGDGRFIVFESDRLNRKPKVFLFDRETRTLLELNQANDATADDGLAAISN